MSAWARRQRGAHLEARAGGGGGSARGHRAPSHRGEWGARSRDSGVPCHAGSGVPGRASVGSQGRAGSGCRRRAPTSRYADPFSSLPSCCAKQFATTVLGYGYVMVKLLRPTVCWLNLCRGKSEIYYCHDFHLKTPCVKAENTLSLKYALVMPEA